MRELTQTNLDPGNCWQTAWACVLDVDPAEMPDQAAIDGHESSYYTPLQAYLREHHGKAFRSVHGRDVLAVIRPATDALHVLCGPTVRSATNGGKNHCIVGRNGVEIWDPHPSRAGLLYAHELEILVPYPEEWRQREQSPCICPRCKKAEAGA